MGLGLALCAGDAFVALPEASVLPYWKATLARGAALQHLQTAAALAATLFAAVMQRSGLRVGAALAMLGSGGVSLAMVAPLEALLAAAQAIDGVTSHRDLVERWGWSHGIRTWLTLTAVALLGPVAIAASRAAGRGVDQDVRLAPGDD